MLQEYVMRIFYIYVKFRSWDYAKNGLQTTLWDLLTAYIYLPLSGAY